LMTGRYPVLPDPRDASLRWSKPDARSFAETLAAHGYRTAAFGDEPLSQKAFSMGLKERGFESCRTKSARCWRGLRLRREDEAPPWAGDG